MKYLFRNLHKQKPLLLKNYQESSIERTYLGQLFGYVYVANTVATTSVISCLWLGICSLWLMPCVRWYCFFSPSSVSDSQIHREAIKYLANSYCLHIFDCSDKQECTCAVIFVPSGSSESGDNRGVFLFGQAFTSSYFVLFAYLACEEGRFNYCPFS